MEVELKHYTNNWCQVRVVTKRRKLHLSYSLRERRFANGYPLARARMDRGFEELEAGFEIERLAEPHVRPLKSVKQTAVVEKAIADTLRNNAGYPYSHIALAEVLARRKTLGLRVTRLRTFYLPAIARTSPHWHSEGEAKYWQYEKGA